MSLRDDLEAAGFNIRIDAPNVVAWKDDGSFIVVNEHTRLIVGESEEDEENHTFQTQRPKLIVHKGRVVPTWEVCVSCRRDLTRAEREQGRSLCLFCEIKYYEY